MKKKQHNLNSLPPGSNLSLLEKEAQVLFQSAKFKQARDIYKQLHKIDSARYASDLIGCYHAQAEQFLMKGMNAEADQIYKQIELLSGQKVCKKTTNASTNQFDGNSNIASFVQCIISSDCLQINRIKAADSIVLQFCNCPLLQESNLSLHEQLSSIYQALELISFADYETATEKVASINFSSPFAHWRLFIRGLVSWHKGEDEKASGAFERIPKDSLLKSVVDGYLLLLSSSELPSHLHKTPELMNIISKIPGKNEFVDAIARAEYLYKSNRAIDAYIHLREEITGFPSACNAFYHDLSSFFLDKKPSEDYNSYIKYIERLCLRIKNVPVKNNYESLIFSKVSALHNVGVDSPERHYNNFQQLCITQFGNSPIIISVIKKYLAMAVISPEIFDKPQDFNHNLPFFDSRKKAIIEELLEKSIDADPGDKETWQFLLTLYKTNKQKAKVSKTLTKISQVFPDDLKTLQEIANLHLESNNYKAAIPILKKVLKADQFDKQSRELLIESLIYQASKSATRILSDTVIKTMQEALEYALPDKLNFTLSKGFILCRSAVLLSRVFKQEEAASSLEQARQIIGDFSTAYFTYCSELQYDGKDPLKLDTIIKEYLKKDDIQEALLTMWGIIAYWIKLKSFRLESEIVRCVKLTSKLFKAPVDPQYARKIYEYVVTTGYLAEKATNQILINQRRYHPENPYFRLCQFELYGCHEGTSKDRLLKLEKIIQDATACGDTDTERKARSLLIHEQQKSTKPQPKRSVPNDLDFPPFPFPLPDFDLPQPRNKKEADELIQLFGEMLNAGGLPPWLEEDYLPRRKTPKKRIVDTKKKK